MNGSLNELDEPGDEPGARTIGALAFKRFVARGAGRGESDGDGGDGPVTLGPFDEDDLDPEHAATERVNFGAVRVPVPRGGEVVGRARGRAPAGRARSGCCPQAGSP